MTSLKIPYDFLFPLSFRKLEEESRRESTSASLFSDNDDISSMVDSDYESDAEGPFAFRRKEGVEYRAPAPLSRNLSKMADDDDDMDTGDESGMDVASPRPETRGEEARDGRDETRGGMDETREGVEGLCLDTESYFWTEVPGISSTYSRYDMDENDIMLIRYPKSKNIIWCPLKFYFASIRSL